MKAPSVSPYDFTVTHSAAPDVSALGIWMATQVAAFFLPYGASSINRVQVGPLGYKITCGGAKGVPTGTLLLSPPGTSKDQPENCWRLNVVAPWDDSSAMMQQDLGAAVGLLQRFT